MRVVAVNVAIDKWGLYKKLERISCDHHFQLPANFFIDFACGKPAGNIGKYDHVTAAQCNIGIMSWEMSTHIMIVWLWGCCKQLKLWWHISPPCSMLLQVWMVTKWVIWTQEPTYILFLQKERGIIKNKLNSKVFDLICCIAITC